MATLSPCVPCTAMSKRSGKRCRNFAIHGGTVCPKHGGSAPQVKRKAQERLADLIDPDRALRELAALSFSNLQDLLAHDGTLLPVKQWPRDVAAAVKSVKIGKINLVAGDGVQEEVVEIHTWDKVNSLRMLLQHLGLLVDKVERTDTLRLELVKRFEEGARRWREAQVVDVESEPVE
jgi:hypothetical protein